MAKVKRNRGDGILKGILLAHLILGLHVVLIAALGLMVLLLRGIVMYMPWIFIGVVATVAGSGLLFYRRMRLSGKTLGELLKSPLFKDRSVEVSLLGGLASLKIGQSERSHALPQTASGQVLAEIPRLEDPETIHTREINELVRLLANDLITIEQYNQVKKQIVGS